LKPLLLLLLLLLDLSLLLLLLLLLFCNMLLLAFPQALCVMSPKLLGLEENEAAPEVVADDPVASGTFGSLSRLQRSDLLLFMPLPLFFKITSIGGVEVCVR